MQKVEIARIVNIHAGARTAAILRVPLEVPFRFNALYTQRMSHQN